MKVALLTNFIPPYRISLLETLAKNVNSLKVFVSTEMEKNRDWKKDHGTLDVVVQKSWSYTKKWINENGYSEQSTVHLPLNTVRLLRKMKPEVVISAELGFRSLLASIYCKLYRKPLILWLTLSERTESNKKGLRKILRKRLLKSATAVLGNGASCERYIRSLNYSGPFFFVPYTTDFIQEEDVSSVHQTRTLLSVGQLIERKGIAEMAAALSRWAKANEDKKVKLLVAGEGPEKKWLDDLKSYENIELELLGNVTYDELPNVYAQADLFLFPTLGDEWGVVVNEALSYQVPVVGSVHSQAVEELIEDEKNGWVFQSDDASDFDRVLNRALSCSDDELIQMKRKCARSLEKVSVASAVENMVKAINYVQSK